MDKARSGNQIESLETQVAHLAALLIQQEQYIAHLEQRVLSFEQTADHALQDSDIQYPTPFEQPHDAPIVPDSDQNTFTYNRQQAETELQHLTTKLKEKAHLLEAIVATTPNLFLVMDREGQYRYANRAALTTLNCELADIIGKTWRDLGFPDALGEQYERDQETVLHTKTATNRQISLLTPDGLRDFAYSLNPVLDKEGDVTSLLATISNITEQKQMEQALRESEEKFRLLVEHAPEAIIISNPAGEIILSNAATESTFGYERHQLEGQPIEILLPEASRSAHQHQRRDFANSPHLRPRNSNLDLSARHRDGTVFPVEVGLNLLEIGGEQIVVSFIVDISQRQQAEQDLRESETRYRTLFGQISDTIFVHDMAGNILDANAVACRTLGYTREEFLTMKTSDIDAPEDATQFRERLRMQLEHGKANNLEIVHLARDGQRIVHDVNTTIIQYEGQLAVLAVCRDITERKQAEQAALALAVEKEKVQMLADFITSASHDFRTPISTLNTSIYLLNRVEDPDRRAYHLDVMYKQTAHLEKLVDALLTLSSLDSARDFDLLPCNPQEMILDLRYKAQEMVKDKQLTLTVSASANLPWIEANNAELHRAFIHLIENAIVYTPEGGSITVTLEGDPTGLLVTVHDTGIGISPEDQQHIFERFYRADKARSTETGGLGLGLSIAKKIVDLHGGRIEVESVLDEGSTFRIWLPGLSK